MVAAILIVLGLFWIGQGAGMIGGSAMTGSTFWAATGVVLVVVGVLTIVREWIARRTPNRRA